MRVFILYGQGGMLTGGGMRVLASKIQKTWLSCDELKITRHFWKEYENLYNEINKVYSSVPIVMIGYSMGANALTSISQILTRPVDLMIGYDPTVWSPIYDVDPLVKRFVHYKNIGPSIFGRSDVKVMDPKKTELRVVKRWSNHFLMCWDPYLHEDTINEIRKLWVKRKFEIDISPK